MCAAVHSVERNSTRALSQRIEIIFKMNSKFNASTLFTRYVFFFVLYFNPNMSNTINNPAGHGTPIEPSDLVLAEFCISKGVFSVTKQLVRVTVTRGTLWSDKA